LVFPLRFSGASRSIDNNDQATSALPKGILLGGNDERALITINDDFSITILDDRSIMGSRSLDIRVPGSRTGS